MSLANFIIFPAAGGKFNAVNYSVKKVEKGGASLMHLENFDKLELQNEISQQEFEDYLKQWSSGSKVKKPVFHAACTSEGKALTHEQLKDIALEVMKDLGYGNNPILIYGHNDTENNHVHIVSTRVDNKGKKIPDNFEGIRARQSLNKILKLNPKAAFNTKLEAALKYKFSTHAQFTLLMEQDGYTVSKNKEDMLFYKNGTKQGAISLKDLNTHIAANNKAKTHSKRLYSLLKKYREQYSGNLRSNRDNKYTDEKLRFESNLTNFMKTKFGIEFIFFAGKNKKQPYGYTIIDHHNKEIFKGGDIMSLEMLTEDVSKGQMFSGEKQADIGIADIEKAEVTFTETMPLDAEKESIGETALDVFEDGLDAFLEGLNENVFVEQINPHEQGGRTDFGDDEDEYRRRRRKKKR